jgi:hypothetical protein
VGTCPVIVNDELAKDLLEVIVVQWDQIVQTLSSESAHQPLAKGVGLGSPDRGSKNSDAEVSQVLVQLFGKDRIPIMDHEPVGMIESQNLSELLDGPFRTGMPGDIQVQDLSRRTSIATNTYTILKVAVIEIKKSQATMAWA